MAISVRGRAAVRSIATTFVRMIKTRMFLPTSIIVSISSSKIGFARLGRRSFIIGGRRTVGFSSIS